MSIFQDLAARAIRSLSRYATQAAPRFPRPRDGRFISGIRDDYSIDSLARKATPERLGNLLKNADQGDIDQQMEFFEEVEKDPVIGRCYFKRRLSVLSKTLQILPADDKNAKAVKAAELVNALILGDAGKPGIQNLGDGLFDLSDAIGKGFAVCQVVWKLESGQWRPKRFEPWPQREFVLVEAGAHYDQEEDRLRIITQEDPVNGVPLDTFPAGQWVVHVQKSFSQPLGRAALFRSVAWYFLFKKFGIKDWAIFLERYGIPPRMAKYDATVDKEERAQLWTALLNMGKDHACIVPDGATIELLQTSNQAGGSATHGELVRYCDDQIAIAINGSTMSISPGERGARSAKESYQDEEWDQTSYDAKKLAETIRDQLVVPIINLNLGPDYPLPRVQFLMEEDEDLEKRSQRDERIQRMGYPIAASYVEETYGIPQPEPGDPVLVKNTPEPFGGFEDEGEDEGDETEESELRSALALLLKAKKKSSSWVRRTHLPTAG